jgi:hypothetical protein
MEMTAAPLELEMDTAPLELETNAAPLVWRWRRRVLGNIEAGAVFG